MCRDEVIAMSVRTATLIPYTRPILATFLWWFAHLYFGPGRGPITPPGPAMVRLDQKDLNSKTKKLTLIPVYCVLLAAFLVVRPPLLGLGRGPITPPGPAMVRVGRSLGETTKTHLTSKPGCRSPGNFLPPHSDRR